MRPITAGDFVSTRKYGRLPHGFYVKRVLQTALAPSGFLVEGYYLADPAFTRFVYTDRPGPAVPSFAGLVDI
jgi:hypothetical protein